MKIVRFSNAHTDWNTNIEKGGQTHKRTGHVIILFIFKSGSCQVQHSAMHHRVRFVGQRFLSKFENWIIFLSTQFDFDCLSSLNKATTAKKMAGGYADPLM